MLTNQLALKYAQAVYELAVEKDMLETVGKQLSLVEATIASHPDLETLIYHPRVQAEAKKETINKIFSQDVAEFVLKFLLLLVEKRREILLPAIIKEYITLSNRARNIVEAEVTTAMPLSDSEQRALIEKLSAVTGKEMVLKLRIDKGILGGVIVKIGDKLIDGSVARQLKTLEAVLLKTELTTIGVTN